jgi:hypothetical protein
LHEKIINYYFSLCFLDDDYDEVEVPAISANDNAAIERV